jgi:hypothetical protein
MSQQNSKTILSSFRNGPIKIPNGSSHPSQQATPMSGSEQQLFIGMNGMNDQYQQYQDLIAKSSNANEMLAASKANSQRPGSAPSNKRPPSPNT